ncbi:hypothetical protein ACIBVP_33250, partial [Actinophytocola sp. NPDC049390]
MVSPELLREGASQGITERYGELAGTVDESGLADATQLLAYVRPARDLVADETTGVVAVSGFGGAGPALPGQNVHWLLADQDFSAGALAAMLVALGVFPSVLPALVASRVAAHSRDRRDALVTALGGRLSHRLWVAVGEARAPVSLGALGAVAVLSWFVTGDRRLPFALCVVAAAVFVLCAAVLRSAVGGVGVSGNRPLREFGRRTRAARTALFPCLVLVAALGRGLARRSREPALLTSGRRMTHHPDAIARQVFGVCATILFLLFALTMQGNFANNAEEAGAYVDEHGYALVGVHPRGGQATAAAVDAFVAAVPDGIEVVAYTQTAAEVRVTGTCAALSSLALPCEERQAEPAPGAFAAWLRQGIQPVLTVAPGAPASAVREETFSLLAFSVDGEDIAAGVLNNAGVAFPFGVATNVPGETWFTGAVPPREQAGWITLVGGFGLVVLIFATGLGLAGEFLRFGRAIAALSVLTGNRRIYWRSAALVALLPLTAAVVGGFAVGYPAVRPLATTGVNLVTPAFVGTCCAAALVAGLVVWLWSARAAVGSADRWRPGRGDDQVWWRGHTQVAQAGSSPGSSAPWIVPPAEPAVLPECRRPPPISWVAAFGVVLGCYFFFAALVRLAVVVLAGVAFLAVDALAVVLAGAAFAVVFA